MGEKKTAAQKKVVNSWEGIEVKPLPHDYDIISRYPIREGLAEVVIATPPGKFAEPTYFCCEVPLNDKEKEVVEKVKEILTKELDFPRFEDLEEVRRAVLQGAERC